MMGSEEYKAWLTSRKGASKKGTIVKIAKLKPPVVPVTPFLTWLLAQVERQDDVGRLARDVQGERKRIGRPLDHLNSRTDLLWYCDMAPASIGLSRIAGLCAWREWLQVERDRGAMP
jgi:hypothetical protein